MTYEEIMEQLQSMGSQQTKKTLLNHGAVEPLFGVKVGDLKTLVKAVKRDQQLALQLFQCGYYEAMYLAGLAVNPSLLSRATLQDWASKINWYAPAEYTVAWVTAESNHAVELAREWIEHPDEMIAVCGWSTYANYVSITADEGLELQELRSLLKRVETDIHNERNRVRYVMNGFVIAVGSYVASLTNEAKSVAEQIGKVHVNMGTTACKVPLALSYIEKVEQKGRIGAKRKTCRC